MEQGATTLWEGWNGGGSRNHIMFGDVSAWFYKALGGINNDPAAPGFKHIIIRPNCVSNLSYVRATYDSIHGPIVSDWKLDRGKFNLHVEIPANTMATVYIPHAKVDEVREGGALATKAVGVAAYRQEPNAAVFEIGSGSYKFISPLAGKPDDLAADPATN
jgi:alpha-L-rhamnosidase